MIKESTPENIPVSEWEQSYEAFANALFTTSAKSETVAFHNSLCYLKTELVFYQTQNSLKKNHMALQFIEKAVYLTDTQISFTERKILSQNQSCILPEVNNESIRWKGSLIELVELVYALHEAGSFGEISLKTLFAFICKMFGCEIANYYRLFWDIKNRAAEERTFFLEKLRKILSDKFTRMDSGGWR